MVRAANRSRGELRGKMLGLDRIFARLRWRRALLIGGAIAALALAYPVRQVSAQPSGDPRSTDSAAAAPATAAGNDPAVPAAAPPAITSTTADEVAIPPRPDEARAAKAYAVFENHCARCHQVGRTERLRPSGGLANILDVDQLMRDPVLVRPGLPDASRLYDILATRHAPLDVYADAASATEPKPEDVEAVREWIADLGSGVQACHARAPITAAAIETLVRDAQTVERDGARDLRFVSLAHLFNACASVSEMAGYRQALTKVLNGVSWSPEVVTLTPLDPSGTLYSFKLADLGWVAADWEALLRGAPPQLGAPLASDVLDRAGTRAPIAAGDWLAAAMSKPPLYYTLLRLPGTLQELARLSGVDMERNLRTGSARRATIRASAVTRGNRLSERHPGALGGFWLVYDFATSLDEQNLFAYPLGPKRTPSISTPFKPDQIRALFALPNGFLASALFDAAGNRIERVIPGVEAAFSGDGMSGSEPGTTPGSQCFACHASGVIGVKDAFRAYAAAEPAALASDVKAAALQLYSSDSELSLLISGDNERYRNAMVTAGIDPSLRLGGKEPVTALAARYHAATSFTAALSQSGLARDKFIDLLTKATGDAAPLARRLQHGSLSRGELNRLFALMSGRDAPSAQADSGGFLRDVQSEIGLSMWLDTPRPSRNDLIGIKVEADRDCYLTIVSVNDEGQATVLFPNDFEPENRLDAHRAIAVPSVNAPYQLRFKSTTAETLLARCSISPAPPAGIEHDFERQKFTVLGNWENFIRDTIETEADLRASPQKVEQAKAARAEAQRRRRSREPRVETPAMTLPAGTLRDGRAVLVIGEN